MKVILISAVANLGKIGDVVQVKNGYARNFLIPNKKAIIYNENNSKIFESKKQNFEEESKKIITISNSIKKSIASNNIIITENASDDGRLYGSVNSSIIAEKINKLVKEDHLTRTNIILKNQIKEIGIYKVTISLHPDAQFDVTVIICRNESEVEGMIKTKKEVENKLKLQQEEDGKKEESKKEIKDDKIEPSKQDVKESDIKLKDQNASQEVLDNSKDDAINDDKNQSSE
jgi:large subunit ribosomal protein L9